MNSVAAALSSCDCFGRVALHTHTVERFSNDCPAHAQCAWQLPYFRGPSVPHLYWRDGFFTRMKRTMLRIHTQVSVLLLVTVAACSSSEPTPDGAAGAPSSRAGAAGAPATSAAGTGGGGAAGAL